MTSRNASAWRFNTSPLLNRLSPFELIFEGFEQTKNHCSSQLTPLGKGWKRADFVSQIVDCWTKQRPSGIIPRVAYFPWQIGKN